MDEQLGKVRRCWWYSGVDEELWGRRRGKRAGGSACGMDEVRGREEVLMAWIKSWGDVGGVSGIDENWEARGAAGGVDEELGAREGVGGMDQKLVDGKRCWCMDTKLGGNRSCWWRGSRAGGM